MKNIEIETNDLSEIVEDVKKGKTCYLLIYANWCGHCTEFKPVWGSVRSEMKNELGPLNAMMLQIEEKNIDKIINKPEFIKNILGYPTVREIDSNGVKDFKEREKKEIMHKIRGKKKGGRTRFKVRRRSRKTKRRRK